MYICLFVCVHSSRCVMDGSDSILLYVFVKVAPQAQFAPNSFFPSPSLSWCMSPFVPIALLCLQLSSISLWCSRSRWRPIQQHQLGLQPTKTLVMPPGYQGHRRANWKQITLTHTCDHIYTWNHTHRQANTLHTHLITQSLTLIHSHTMRHTHLHFVFQRPLRLPKGSTSGWEEGGQFIVSYEEHGKQTRDSTDG